MECMSWGWKTRGMGREKQKPTRAGHADTLGIWPTPGPERPEGNPHPLDSQPAPGLVIFLTTSQEWVGRISSQGSGKAPTPGPSIPGFGWAYLLLCAHAAASAHGVGLIQCLRVPLLVLWECAPREGGLPRLVLKVLYCGQKRDVSTQEEGKSEWLWVLSLAPSGLRLEL